LSSRAPLIFDLHCDTPHNIKSGRFRHVIPEYLFHDHYLGAIFAHFVEPHKHFPFVEAVTLIMSTLAYIHEKKHLHVIHTHQEISKTKTNILLGVEGGHIFDNTVKQLETFYDLGVRVFTVTWNNSNELAHSAFGNDNKGLTKRGKDFVRELNNYDVILDLSHASTRTVLDVCEMSDNNVIASHSCVRTLRPAFMRNISDRALKAIARKGGVVGINFSEYHLGGHSVADHIDYIKDSFGIDAAAIGSDFDGIDDAVITSPQGIRTLEKELGERGYSMAEIEQVFSGNFLRVLKQTVGSKQ